MECPSSGNKAGYNFFDPEPFLDVVGVEIVKPGLSGVDTSEDVHLRVDDHGRVTVSAERLLSFLLLDVVPHVCFEGVLVDVIHCKVAVPASESIERVIVDNRSVAKSI